MKSKSQRQRAGRRKAASPAVATVVPVVTLSPRRKWLFRLVALVLLPLIAVGGLELLLRLLGVGFDPNFFRRETIGGRDCYVANDSFGLRFFPKSMARNPPPVVMSANKEPDIFRIFIFGESAALGDPRPNYGAASYLEALLAERFPEARFEVVNTAVTAINSHVILPIARECSNREGDLWIVYMGNNEMVGPFGAATVFGGQAPPNWLIKTQLQLKRLRLTQLLNEAGQRLQKTGSASRSWGGMEMFTQNQVPPNDPRKQRVYKNFERNLEGILSAGLDSGAKVVLSTVAVNLRDCSPFGTLLKDDQISDNHALYQQLRRDGAAAEGEGRFVEAQSHFRRATEILPEAAEAHFRLGRTLVNLTNGAAARAHFVKAMDLDTLPFRADSRINETIQTMARKLGSGSLALCDAAEALGASSPSGLAGQEFFYEHVHLNPNGNYLLAIAWAGQVEKFLDPALKRSARQGWISQAECEELLGLTDWNRVSILEDMVGRMQRPPFDGQFDNSQRVARLRGEIEGLRKRLTDEAAATARETYLRSLRRAPENFRLHENYAEFLEARHELNLAIVERRRVCELLPHTYFPYYTLGVDLKEAGNLAEARDVLLKAAALKPDGGEIRLELGMVYGRQAEWESARRELEAARRFSPEDPKASLYLGEVLWKLGQGSEAVTNLREAIRLDPTDWQPHYRLASILAQQHDFSGAATEFQEVLRLNPAYGTAKLGLAAALANLGRGPEAIQLLNEVLIQEPGNPAAMELRDRIRGR